MKRILHISKYYKPFIGGIEEMARDNVLTLKGKAEQKVFCFNHESHSKLFSHTYKKNVNKLIAKMGE